jgi:hypothetical protein
MCLEAENTIPLPSEIQVLQSMITIIKQQVIIDLPTISPKLFS